MNHQYFAFWRNSYRLTSLVVGWIFLMTALPAFAQFKPRDRKPASANTREVIRCSHFSNFPLIKLYIFGNRSQGNRQTTAKIITPAAQWGTRSQFKPRDRQLPREYYSTAGRYIAR